ncbi:uncharacterized protein LOC128678286 [Plodia interpunctella]|uniref:uncharacterized protein LOC128678286 n=1 Tax=Plodia interpunctella TaxID=58824 RepID=UPI0023675425|nr:uncharacterized protein LOC128678286 [Plodia interpunctella]
MLEEMVDDYSSYLKLDVSNSFQTVQDVIDNMLTRLEELTSVLQIIKSKNQDCNSSVTNDIRKYRNEISSLSKKIATLNTVIMKLRCNVDRIEKQVEKAEADFGIINDNKIKNLLKPFLKRNSVPPASNVTINVPEKAQFISVLDNFDSDPS